MAFPYPVLFTKIVLPDWNLSSRSSAGAAGSVAVVREYFSLNRLPPESVTRDNLSIGPKRRAL